MTTQAIDHAASVAAAATPALAAIGTNSPLWMIVMAAAAGAMVWTVAQKPTTFWPAMSMMLTGTFIGVVGSKAAISWAKSTDGLKWIADVDQEYIAAALGLLGNLLFTLILARAKKEE